MIPAVPGKVPPVASGTGKWAVASSTARPLAAEEVEKKNRFLRFQVLDL